MHAIKLKETLIEMKSNHFQIKAEVDSELTSAMLEHIGNVDPILRDELIYAAFGQFILNGSYTEKQLHHILKTCLDKEHLFYRIGNTGDDSVFTRSFSSLVIALILYVNEENRFLAVEAVHSTAEKLLNYLEQEQDVRGLVPEKGWAHSIAHIADALDGLVKQPDLSKSWLEATFQAIMDKMAFTDGVYVYEEYVRMTLPVIGLLQKGLHETFVCDTIKQITCDLNNTFSIDDVQLFTCRANMKQFLQSLYFHLSYQKQFKSIQDCLKQALFQLNAPYYP